MISFNVIKLEITVSFLTDDNSFGIDSYHDIKSLLVAIKLLKMFIPSFEVSEYVIILIIPEMIKGKNLNENEIFGK